VSHVHRPQANGAGVVDFGQDKFSLFFLPPVNADHLRANRVVGENQLARVGIEQLARLRIELHILCGDERADAFPTRDLVIDPENAIIESEFPKSPFRRIIRAPSAMDDGLISWLELRLGPIDG
jgi:hypothetical protein